jgi:tRNA G18 (ribose-2'-O)-methylase SpoU
MKLGDEEQWAGGKEEEPPTAVVFGNEVKGVHQEVIDECDGCLEIPQYGTKHSLNVSVTAGIVIWKWSCKFFPKK